MPSPQRPAKKKSSAVLIIAIVAAFFFFVIPAAIFFISSVSSGNQSVNEEPIQGDSNEIKPQWVGKKDVKDVNPGRLYDHLSDDEKKVYDMISDQFEGEGKTDIVYVDKMCGNDEYQSINCAYSNDNPYAGDINFYLQVQFTDQEPFYVSIKEKLRDPQSDYREVKPLVEKVASELKGADSEKVKEIHDYICDNVDNDLEAENIFHPMEH